MSRGAQCGRRGKERNVDELVSIEVRSCQNQFDDVFLGVTHGDLTKKMDSNGDLTNQTGRLNRQMMKCGVLRYFQHCSGCELAGKKMEIGRCHWVKSCFFLFFFASKRFWNEFLHPNVLDTIEAGFPQFVAIVFDFFWRLNHMKGLAQKV